MSYKLLYYRTDEIETLIEQSKNASGSSKVVITPSRVSETEM